MYRSNSSSSKKAPCRFFNSSAGCRYGSRCKFAHEANVSSLPELFESLQLQDPVFVEDEDKDAFSSNVSVCLSSTSAQTSGSRWLSSDDEHLSVSITPTFVGTFGWTERNEPTFSIRNSDTELYRYFSSRLDFPGRPPMLIQPVPTTMTIQMRHDFHNCPEYDRPPVEAILQAAIHYGFDFTKVHFVTPRRNLLKFLPENSKRMIDVQRPSAKLPIFMRRVIDYKGVDYGDPGYEFERQLTTTNTSSSNARQQFRLLVNVHVGDHSILMSGEVDSVLPESKTKEKEKEKSTETTDTKEQKSSTSSSSASSSSSSSSASTSTSTSTTFPPSFLSRVRELKTVLPNLFSKRSPKFYLQQKLVGTPATIVGFKEKNYYGFTMSIEEMTTEQIGKQIKAESLHTQLKNVLDWIEKVTPVDEGTVYRVNLKNKTITLSPTTKPIVSKGMLKLLLARLPSQEKKQDVVKKKTVETSLQQEEVKVCAKVVSASSSTTTTSSSSTSSLSTDSSSSTSSNSSSKSS